MGVFARDMVVYWTVVLATWLCSSTVAMADSGHDQPPTVPICSREGAHDRQLNAAFPDYPTVKFTTNGFVTKKYYRQFLKTIRGRVANESDTRPGIPVLPNPSAVSDSQRFVMVELSNNAEDVVTLAIDVTNMNVVAYRVEDESYFFQEAPDVAFTELFTSTNQNTLTYSGNYKDLLRVAGLSDLDRVQVGMQELDTSISLLFHRSGAHIDQEKVACSLIICILMISEAVRFRHIEQRVAETLRSDSYGSFSPNGAVISLVRSWSQLSRGIQESNKDGSFREIQLQRADYSDRLMVSDGMPDLVFAIGIMLYICEKPQTPRSSLLIKPAVNAYNDGTCTDEEVKVRIIGRNGLCVTVKDGIFELGQHIILSPCRSANTNQLWTLKKDGTIESKGWCIASLVPQMGFIVFLSYCYPFLGQDPYWQIRDDGTVIHSESSLALSATLGTSGTILTVEVNNYSSRQGWLASNDSKPFARSIVGFKDLCMEAKSNTVRLEECESKVEQQWVLYPDRTIRPYWSQDLCLSYYKDQFDDINIINIICCSGLSRERWLFRNDGSILNPYTGLVMNVRSSSSNPSLHQVIMWQFTGNLNQK